MPKFLIVMFALLQYCGALATHKSQLTTTEKTYINLHRKCASGFNYLKK